MSTDLATLHDLVARKAARALAPEALATLFTEARTANGFLPKPVEESTLRRLIELTEWAPTSANQSPGRFVFVQSPAAKERLKRALAPNNVEKTMGAPVTVIVAQDLHFYEHLPKLFPHVDAKAWFEGDGKEDFRQVSAFRNGTLQGAYLILAARALGLDAGPMSGFDHAILDTEFFAGTHLRSNFLINLGYGDDTKLFPRNPRLSFEEVTSIV